MTIAPQFTVQDTIDNDQQIIVQRVKGILEALLFCSSQPLSIAQIQTTTGNGYPFEGSFLLKMLKEMQQEYASEKYAIQLEQVAEGFLLKTKPQYAEYIQRLKHFSCAKPERLSSAAAEILAIIAYRQPITRSEIEAIRGVDSSGSIYALIEKDLIYITGKKEVIGRPSIYSVTPRFFQHFGIDSLKNLPLHAELSNPKNSKP